MRSHAKNIAHLKREVNTNAKKTAFIFHDFVRLFPNPLGAGLAPALFVHSLISLRINKDKSRKKSEKERRES
jgi:hypothetical protein